jgi:hypothetical protein
MLLKGIEPIQLTPEILTASGFACFDYYAPHPISQTWKLFKKQLLPDEWLVVNIDDSAAFIMKKSMENTAGLFPMGNVHQFQNLYFALTGQEPILDLTSGGTAMSGTQKN